MGFAAWLQSQFALNTSDLPDQPILNSAGKSNNNAGPVQAVFFQNTVANQDQLRQRVAFILSQIWVVSQQSGVTPAYAYPPYWRLFRDNAFGNYPDVIKAITLSPAMGRYLNMANNNKANSKNGTVPNENYARELMQLFTLGLNQLNPFTAAWRSIPTTTSRSPTIRPTSPGCLSPSPAGPTPPRPARPRKTTIPRTTPAPCSPSTPNTTKPRKPFSATSPSPRAELRSRISIPSLPV